MHNGPIVKEALVQIFVLVLKCNQNPFKAHQSHREKHHQEAATAASFSSIKKQTIREVK